MSGKPGRRWKPENLKPCGTDAAYKRHLRHHEVPCDPCDAAHRQYDDATAYQRGVRHAREQVRIDGLLCELIASLAMVFTTPPDEDGAA